MLLNKKLREEQIRGTLYRLLNKKSREERAERTKIRDTKYLPFKADGMGQFMNGAAFEIYKSCTNTFSRLSLDSVDCIDCKMYLNMTN